MKPRPDPAIGFSDTRPHVAAALIRRASSVNHGSVEGILDDVRRPGALMGVPVHANACADELARGLAAVRDDAMRLPVRPRVYFEERDER